MDDKQVNQNESIKNGLEKFIDQQMFGLDDIPRARQERGTEYGKRQDNRAHRGNSSYKENKPHGEMEPYDAYASEEEGAYEEYETYGEDEDGGYGRQGVGDASAGSARSRQAIRRQQESGVRGAHGTHRTYEAERRNVGNGEKTGYRSGQAKRSSKNGNRDADGTHDRNKKQRQKENRKKAENIKISSDRGSAGKKNSGSKKKKPMSKLKKVLIVLFVIFLAVFLWWYIMVVNVYQKMHYEKSDDIIEGSLKEEGVINILLIGNDSRQQGDDGRSDAMILLSISEKQKTIYMTSLLRDMYVEIPGHDANRLNAAYSYGGPALLCATIEQNLGIEINRYAIVNFQAFAAVVDAVGGVDIELTGEEVHWVNAYLNEYNLLEGRELTTDYLDESQSGMLHLNGPQALAYCRNRYIGTDFGRTQRQRNVLSAIAKKLPMAMATNSADLINGLFPNLTTNMKQSEVYALSLGAAKYLTYETEQLTVPAEGTYSNATIRKMMVLQVDFEANKKLLRERIYGEGSE